MAATLEPVPRCDLGLSWRAIFVGLVLGLATQFLLTLLGVSIGLSSLHFSGEEANAEGVGLGAALWALVVPILSWFLGAYAASYAAGVFDRNVGVLHGLTTWGLGLMTVLVLLGSGVSGAFSSTFGTVETTARTLSQAGLIRRSDVPLLQGGHVEQHLSRANTPAEAERAAHDLARGAWAAFATVLLSLCAACLGGAAGSRYLIGHIGDRERRDRETPSRPPIQSPRTT